MKWLVIASRVAVGALFVYAAATKLPDLHAFAADVANYRVVPASAVPYVAAAVVGIELVAGLALVTGLFARAGAVVISGMLVVFIGFIAQALVRGIDLRCGCFGGDELASWWTVGRDVAMLVPALIVVFVRGERFRAAS